MDKTIREILEELIRKTNKGGVYMKAGGRKAIVKAESDIEAVITAEIEKEKLIASSPGMLASNMDAHKHNAVLDKITRVIARLMKKE